MHIQHTIANVLKHAVRRLALAVTPSTNGTITQRCAKAFKTEVWENLILECEATGGEQTTKLLRNKGSMVDRTYGLCGLVMALNCMPKFKREHGIFVHLFDLLLSIVSYLMDGACGLCIEPLEKDFTALRTCWIEISIATNDTSLPISVHSFFHLLALIPKFGALTLYSVHHHESHHRVKKSAIEHNTNHVKGETGEDYLAQVMRRESRGTSLRYVQHIETTPPARPSGFSLHTSLKPTLQPSRAAKDFKQKHFVLEEALKDFAKHFPDANLAYNTSRMPVVYRTVDISIASNEGWLAMATKNFKPFSLKDCVLALAPLGDGYAEARKAHLLQMGGCEYDTCLACSSLELQSTLALNFNPRTRDILVAPLGYIEIKGKMWVLGIELFPLSNLADVVISEVKLKPGKQALAAFPVEAIRGECMYNKTPKGCFVLRRFRHTLS